MKRTPHSQAWAALIRERRTFLKLTQTDLANEIGVTQVAVSGWESGERVPSARAQTALVRILGIDPVTLHRIYSAAGEAA